MATKKSETGEATVKDFSDGKDGSTEVSVNYSFEFNELENAAELAAEFSPADLLKLANQRIKASANSAARQKAISPYAPDPNSPDQIRKRMIADYLKLPGKTLAQAEKFVDSMLAD